MTEQELKVGKWFIAWQHKNTVEYLHAPDNYFYADPMPVKYNNKIYVFFELYNYQKGKLAYFTLENKQVKLLDINIPCHASYPYIFEYNNQVYMIPETCYLNSINLYRCIEFPDKWQFERKLISNIHAGDSSLLFYNNLWWIFTTKHINQKDSFCIYYTTDLFGEWKEHKLINSEYIIDNSNFTRGAGKIFIQNNKIIRPAQFSVYLKGEAVMLYEVTKLNQEEYSERVYKVISKQDFALDLMHTYNICDEYTIVDGRMKKPNEEIKDKLDSRINQVVQDNIYIKQDKIQEAFSYNTSGNGKCYYGAIINKVKYEGERDWDERWKLIKDLNIFENKQILELGCNMAILSVYLSKFCGIKSSVAVDAPDEFLKLTNKSDTIKAARALIDGMLVSNIVLRQIDLNQVNYEGILGVNYDICCVLSLYKWIEDKERFLKYLNSFKCILYEGHEDNQTEINRFSRYKARILGETQTGKSYASDNFRSLILFER